MAAAVMSTAAEGSSLACAAALLRSSSGTAAVSYRGGLAVSRPAPAAAGDLNALGGGGETDGAAVDASACSSSVVAAALDGSVAAACCAAAESAASCAAVAAGPACAAAPPLVDSQPRTAAAANYATEAAACNAAADCCSGASTGAAGITAVRFGYRAASYSLRCRAPPNSRCSKSKSSSSSDSSSEGDSGRRGSSSGGRRNTRNDMADSSEGRTNSSSNAVGGSGSSSNYGCALVDARDVTVLRLYIQLFEQQEEGRTWEKSSSSSRTGALFPFDGGSCSNRASPLYDSSSRRSRRGSSGRVEEDFSLRRRLRSTLQLLLLLRQMEVLGSRMWVLLLQEEMQKKRQRQQKQRQQQRQRQHHQEEHMQKQQQHSQKQMRHQQLHQQHDQLPPPQCSQQLESATSTEAAVAAATEKWARSSCMSQGQALRWIFARYRSVQVLTALECWLHWEAGQRSEGRSTAEQQQQQEPCLERSMEGEKGEEARADFFDSAEREQQRRLLLAARLAAHPDQKKKKQRGDYVGGTAAAAFPEGGDGSAAGAAAGGAEKTAAAAATASASSAFSSSVGTFYHADWPYRSSNGGPPPAAGGFAAAVGSLPTAAAAHTGGGTPAGGTSTPPFVSATDRRAASAFYRLLWNLLRRGELLRAEQFAVQHGASWLVEILRGTDPWMEPLVASRDVNLWDACLVDDVLSAAEQQALTDSSSLLKACLWPSGYSLGELSFVASHASTVGSCSRQQPPKGSSSSSGSSFRRSSLTQLKPPQQQQQTAGRQQREQLRQQQSFRRGGTLGGSGQTAEGEEQLQQQEADEEKWEIPAAAPAAEDVVLAAARSLHTLRAAAATEGGCAAVAAAAEEAAQQAAGAGDEAPARHPPFFLPAGVDSNAPVLRYGEGKKGRDLLLYACRQILRKRSEASCRGSSRSCSWQSGACSRESSSSRAAGGSCWEWVAGRGPLGVLRGVGVGEALAAEEDMNGYCMQREEAALYGHLLGDFAAMAAMAASWSDGLYALVRALKASIIEEALRCMRAEQPHGRFAGELRGGSSALLPSPISFPSSSLAALALFLRSLTSNSEEVSALQQQRNHGKYSTAGEEEEGPSAQERSSREEGVQQQQQQQQQGHQQQRDARAVLLERVVRGVAFGEGAAAEGEAGASTTYSSSGVAPERPQQQQQWQAYHSRPRQRKADEAATEGLAASAWKRQLQELLGTQGCSREFAALRVDQAALRLLFGAFADLPLLLRPFVTDAAVHARAAAEAEDEVRLLQLLLAGSFLESSSSLALRQLLFDFAVSMHAKGERSAAAAATQHASPLSAATAEPAFEIPAAAAAAGARESDMWPAAAAAAGAHYGGFAAAFTGEAGDAPRVQHAALYFPKDAAGETDTNVSAAAGPGCSSSEAAGGAAKQREFSCARRANLLLQRIAAKGVRVALPVGGGRLRMIATASPVLQEFAALLAVLHHDLLRPLLLPGTAAASDPPALRLFSYLPSLLPVCAGPTSAVAAALSAAEETLLRHGMLPSAAPAVSDAAAASAVDATSWAASAPAAFCMRFDLQRQSLLQQRGQLRGLLSLRDTDTLVGAFVAQLLQQTEAEKVVESGRIVEFSRYLSTFKRVTLLVEWLWHTYGEDGISWRAEDGRHLRRALAWVASYFPWDVLLVALALSEKVWNRAAPRVHVRGGGLAAFCGAAAAAAANVGTEETLRSRTYDLFAEEEDLDATDTGQKISWIEFAVFTISAVFTLFYTEPRLRMHADAPLLLLTKAFLRAASLAQPLSSTHLSSASPAAIAAASAAAAGDGHPTSCTAAAVAGSGGSAAADLGGATAAAGGVAAGTLSVCDTAAPLQQAPPRVDSSAAAAEAPQQAAQKKVPKRCRSACSSSSSSVLSAEHPDATGQQMLQKHDRGAVLQEEESAMEGVIFCSPSVAPTGATGALPLQQRLRPLLPLVDLALCCLSAVNYLALLGLFFETRCLLQQCTLQEQQRRIDLERRRLQSRQQQQQSSAVSKDERQLKRLSGDTRRWLEAPPVSAAAGAALAAATAACESPGAAVAAAAQKSEAQRPCGMSDWLRTAVEPSLVNVLLDLLLQLVERSGGEAAAGEAAPGEAQQQRSSSSTTTTTDSGQSLSTRHRRQQEASSDAQSTLSRLSEALRRGLPTFAVGGMHVVTTPLLQFCDLLRVADLLHALKQQQRSLQLCSSTSGFAASDAGRGTATAAAAQDDVVAEAAAAVFRFVLPVAVAPQTPRHAAAAAAGSGDFFPLVADARRQRQRRAAAAKELQQRRQLQRFRTRINSVLCLSSSGRMQHPRDSITRCSGIDSSNNSKTDNDKQQPAAGWNRTGEQLAEAGDEQVARQEQQLQQMRQQRDQRLDLTAGFHLPFFCESRDGLFSAVLVDGATAGAAAACCMRSRTLRSKLLLCEAEQQQVAQRLRTVEECMRSVIVRQQQGEQQDAARGTERRPYSQAASRLQQRRMALMQRYVQLQQEAAATQQLLDVLQEEEQRAAAAASASAAALLRPNEIEEPNDVTAAAEAGDKASCSVPWNFREADKAGAVLLFLRSKLLELLRQLLLLSDRRRAMRLKREAAAMKCMQPLLLSPAGAASARSAAAAAEDKDIQSASAVEQLTAAGATGLSGAAAAAGARRLGAEAAASLAAGGGDMLSATETSPVGTAEGDSEFAQQKTQIWQRSEECLLPLPGGPLGPASFFSMASHLSFESDFPGEGNACVLLRQALAAADDWRSL